MFDLLLLFSSTEKCVQWTEEKQRKKKKDNDKNLANHWANGKDVLMAFFFRPSSRLQTFKL